MANNEKIKITASVKLNHPWWQRIRAGIKFTSDAAEYLVTKEQFEVISNDPYLKIYGKPNESTDDKNDNAAKSKAKIIKDLKAKWLKEGEDFDAEADEATLAELLASA